MNDFKTYRITSDEKQKIISAIRSFLERHDLNVINRADLFLIKDVIQGELLFTKDENLWADLVVYHGKLYAGEGKQLLHHMKEAIFE